MTVTNGVTKETLQDALALIEGQNLIKASLFNLVVIAQNPEHIEHCEQLVRIITEKFPCKIIFVQADPQARMDYLQTTKTVLMIGEGNNRVLCDQIKIEASATQFSKLPFLILPYLQPDLPIFGLLTHDPSTDTLILPELQKYACRVIYDPDPIDNCKRFSEGILALLKNARAIFIDMNWARLQAWREVIVTAFDSQENFSQLQNSKMIQISYCISRDQKGHRPDMQAIYLQAWLASILQWELMTVEKENGAIRISYKRDQHSIAVSLLPKDTGILPPGAIFSLEAMTKDDYHFLLTHEVDSKLVKVHASNPTRCEIPFTIFLSNYQNGPALVTEIFFDQPTDHYNKMLEKLISPLWSRC